MRSPERHGGGPPAGSCARLILAVAIAAALGPAQTVSAHPAVSLVQDSRGNLYFSDLESVRVLRPDGSLEIVLAGVHTHELWLGAGDVLYGEDVANVGDDYRHRVWRLEPDGTVSDVIPWRAGFPADFHDYGFARDAVGNMYVLRPDDRCIEVRDAAGSVNRRLEFGARAGFVHWLVVESTGRVHVAVGDALLRFEPDSHPVQVLASDLIERTDRFAWVHDRHALMGMWTDAQGSVYVSVYAGQVVKKVAESGEVSIVARSGGGWSPVGGTVGSDGALRLLEWSDSNQVRVREIGAGGAERIFTVD